MTVPLTALPAIITAGDSIAWTLTRDDFPASDGWTLSFVFINASSKIAMSSTADGDRHAIAIEATTTAVYVPGKYTYAGFATNGTVRHTIDRGSIEVYPNLATQTTYDGRAWYDKAIEALEAAIAGRADKTQMSQVLPNGVQVQHLALKDQIEALQQIKWTKARTEGSCRKTITPRFRN